MVIIIFLGIIISIKILESIKSGINVNNEIQNNNQIITEETEKNIIGGSDNMSNENDQSKNTKINLIINNKKFSASLENNETTRELVKMLPLTLNMSEMNSNEKYNYLESSLPTNSSVPNRINAGDIKLYGNDCLVIFYKSFNTSYSYTNLGKIDNANEFISELGRGNVTITFELAN